MIALNKTRVYQNGEYISPGVVGSVGDVLPSVRLRTSAYDMPMEFEASSSFGNAVYFGSNVQDGNSRSFESGGRNAATYDSNWSNRKFKTNYGWKFQDLRQPSTMKEPVVIGIPQYKWNNTVATVYNARVTGDKFLPLPGRYGPAGGILRGGQVPMITNREAQEGVVEPSIVRGFQGVPSRSLQFGESARGSNNRSGPPPAGPMAMLA